MQKNVTVHTLSDLWLIGSFRNLFGVRNVFFENILLFDGSEGLAPRAISHRSVNCNKKANKKRKKSKQKAQKMLAVQVFL